MPIALARVIPIAFDPAGLALERPIEARLGTPRVHLLNDLAAMTQDSLDAGYTGLRHSVQIYAETPDCAGVNEFVRDDLGDSVKGLVQRYDVSQMRDFMRGLR